MVVCKRCWDLLCGGDQIAASPSQQPSPSIEGSNLQESSLSTGRSVRGNGSFVSPRILADIEAMEMSVPEALKNTAQHPLEAVVKALSQSLRNFPRPICLDLLRFTCPFQAKFASCEDVFEDQIAEWLHFFLHVTDSMPTNITDDVTTRQLKVAFRSVMDIVALWHGDIDFRYIKELTKDWIIQVLVQVSEGKISESGINVNRLEHILSVSAKEGLNFEDVFGGLSNFGIAQKYIAELKKHNDVAISLLRKLHECQESEEEYETFTCRKLVENGRIAKGLGIVVFRESQTHRLHIFFYDWRGLMKWRSDCIQRGRSPCNPGSNERLSRSLLQMQIS